MRPLADVARDAPDSEWMQRSFATCEGQRRYLLRVHGYCCAYAAECLAHAFDETRGPNARFSQRDFRYRFDEPTADAWGDFLDAGGDADICDWHDAPVARYEPGDMLFWRANVRGYRYYAGHVAIVVRTDGGVTVSENSSSRGIGIHSIGSAALGTVAGVARWALPEDVQYDDWAAEAVEWGKRTGIMVGRGDGYAGREPMTRQELIVVVKRLFDLLREED